MDLQEKIQKVTNKQKVKADKLGISMSNEAIQSYDILDRNIEQRQIQKSILETQKVLNTFKTINEITKPQHISKSNLIEPKNTYISQFEAINNLKAHNLENQIKQDKLDSEIESLQNLKKDVAIKDISNTITKSYTENNKLWTKGDTSGPTASYGFLPALGDTVTRGLAGVIQGTGQSIDAYFNSKMARRDATEAFSKHLAKNPGDLIGARKVAEQVKKERNDLYDKHLHPSTDAANTIASPFTNARANINYQSLHGNSDSFLDVFSRDGLLSGALNVLGASVDQAPSIIGGAIASKNLAGLGLFGLASLAEHNKEKTAKEKGIPVSQVKDVNSKVDIYDVLAAAGSALATVPERYLLTNKVPGMNIGFKNTFSKVNQVFNKNGMLGTKAGGEFAKAHPFRSGINTASGIALSSLAGLGAYGAKAYGLEYISEALDEASKKIGNGEWKNKNFFENLEDIHEAGKLGGIIGVGMGAMTSPLHMANTESFNKLKELGSEYLKDKKNAASDIGIDTDNLSSIDDKEFDSNKDYYTNLANTLLKTELSNEDKATLTEAFNKNENLIGGILKAIYDGKIKNINYKGKDIEAKAALSQISNDLETRINKAIDEAGKNPNELSIDLSDLSALEQGLLQLQYKNPTWLRKFFETEELENEAEEDTENSDKNNNLNARIDKTVTILKDAARQVYKNNEEDLQEILGIIDVIASHAKEGKFRAASVAVTGYKGQESILDYITRLNNLSGNALKETKEKLQAFQASQNSKKKFYESVKKDISDSKEFSPVIYFNQNDGTNNFTKEKVIANENGQYTLNHLDADGKEVVSIFTNRNDYMTARKEQLKSSGFLVFDSTNIDSSKITIDNLLNTIKAEDKLRERVLAKYDDKIAKEEQKAKEKVNPEEEMDAESKAVMDELDESKKQDESKKEEPKVEKEKSSSKSKEILEESKKAKEAWSTEKKPEKNEDDDIVDETQNKTENKDTSAVKTIDSDKSYLDPTNYNNEVKNDIGKLKNAFIEKLGFTRWIEDKINKYFKDFLKLYKSINPNLSKEEFEKNISEAFSISKKREGIKDLYNKLLQEFIEDNYKDSSETIEELENSFIDFLGEKDGKKEGGKQISLGDLEQHLNKATDEYKKSDIENTIKNIKAYVYAVFSRFKLSKNADSNNLLLNPSYIRDEFIETLSQFIGDLTNLQSLKGFEIKKGKSKIDEIAQLYARINQILDNKYRSIFNKLSDNLSNKKVKRQGFRIGSSSNGDVILRINNFINFIRDDRSENENNERSKISQSIRLAMFIAVFEQVNNPLFSSYRDNLKLTEDLESVFGIGKIEFQNGIQNDIRQGIFETKLKERIGERILNLLSLEVKKDEALFDNRKRAADELAEYIIGAFVDIGIFENISVNREDILSDSDGDKSKLNFIKLKDGASKALFSKTTTNSKNSTTQEVSTYNDSFRLLDAFLNANNLSREGVREQFSFTPHGEASKFQKNTRGKNIQVSPNTRKSLEISQNSPFGMSTTFDFLYNLFISNVGDNGLTLTKEDLYKAFTDKFGNIAYFPEVLNDKENSKGEHTVLFDDRDTAKGKTITTMNEVDALLGFMTELYNKMKQENKTTPDPVYFKYAISGNFREFLQNRGINPQSSKLARFLLIPEKGIGEYIKTKDGMIDHPEADVVYTSIAQSFGHSTDKSSPDSNIEFGKKVFRLIFGEGGIGYEKFKEAVIKSIRSAYTEGHKINFSKVEGIEKNEILDGIELNFEELGHALSALAALENHHKAKVGEKYKAAYLSESDGINNGPAIKLLQYMLDPMYLKLLQTVGIDLLNEIEIDEIASYLGGERTLKNKEKINDLYQRVAKILSDKLIEELDIYSNTDKELVALYKEKFPDASETTIKEKIKEKKEEYNKKLAKIIGVPEDLYNSNIILQKTVEHIMKFLSNSFALDDKGNVIKKARENAKPITQVFNYGAGDSSQLRNLIDTFMESIPKLAYKAIQKYKTNETLESGELDALNIIKSFYGSVENGEFKVADTNLIEGYLENGVGVERDIYENGKRKKDEKGKPVKKVVKISLFDNKVLFIGKDSEGRKATNGETGISTNLTLRTLFKKAVTAALEDIIPKIMNSVFPYVKAQNNLTNNIFNLQLSIVQAIYEGKVKEATENGKRILTVRELEGINKKIEKRLPGIKLSIESNSPFIQSKIEGQLKMVGKERSVDIENSFQMMTGSAEGSSVPESKKLNGFKVTYGNVGASPNVISIHQEDGSAMMLTTIQVSREFTNNERAFLGIHDALMMEASLLKKFGKRYNKIAFELNKNSKTLKNNIHIAAESYFLIENALTESFTTQTGGVVNARTMKAHATLNLAHQSLMYLVSSVNRHFAFHFPINYNNVQNGVKGTGFAYKPTDYGLIDFSQLTDENGNKLKLEDLQIKTAEVHLENSSLSDTEKRIIKEFSRLNNLAMQLEEKLIRAKEGKDIKNGVIYTGENNKTSTSAEILGDIDEKGKSKGGLLNDIIKLMNEIIEETNTRNKKIQKLINKKDLKAIDFKPMNKIETIDDLLNMALSEKEMDILGETYKNKELTQDEINEKVNNIVSKIEDIISRNKDKLPIKTTSKEIEELKQEIDKLTNAKNITEKFANSYVPAIEELKISLGRMFRTFDTTKDEKLIKNINSLINELAYLNSSRTLKDAKDAYNRKNGKYNFDEEKITDDEVKNVSKTEIKENLEELVDEGIIPSDNTLQEASKEVQESYKDSLEEFFGEDIVDSPSTDTDENIPDDLIEDIDGKDQEGKANELGAEQEEDYNSSRDTSGIKNTKILSDDISNAKDTVLEIKNELRQMDKEQGHSLNEEHSKRLTKVLTNILSPFMNAVKGVKVKLEEGHKRNSGGFNPTTNTITMRVMSKAQAFLGWMTREEAYCHETTHSATHFAIRINNGNNKYARQLSALYRIFKEKVTVKDIAKALNLKSPEENLRVANLMYKHMTKYDLITNLEEFNAMGVSSEAMYKVLNSIKYKEKEKETTLYGKLTSLLKDSFDFLFGDGIHFIGKDASLYDALLSLNKKLVRANNKAREQVNANGGYKLAIKETIRNKLDRKGAELIDFSIRGVGKGVSRILTGQSRKYITFKTFREFVTLSTLAIFDPDFRKEFRKAVKDYPLLSYKSTMGSIIEDISTPSVIGRIAQFLQKKSNIIDGKRQFIEKLAGNEIKSLFTQELDKKDSQILGEILLNSDLSSLNMDSFEIADLLSNPDNLKKAIAEKEKEIYDIIDSVFDEKTYKCRVGQYKNYIKNRSNALAYYMTTGRATDIFIQRNAYNIVKLMGTTKGSIGADEALIPLVDKYITLLSLDLQPETMRIKVANIAKNNSNGFNTALQWHNGHKTNMLREAYNGKRHLEIKGYKEDITDKTVNIRVGRVKDREKFAKIGYIPLDDQINTTSHRLLKGHDRCYYVNTFIETDSKFNRTGVRYTKNIHRGTDIKNLLRLDIAEHFESKEQYEREYKTIMKDIYKEMKSIMDDSMVYDIPRNLKGGNVALIPIYSEQGNIQTFDFIMEHSFKSDVLKLDYDLFDNIGKMSAKLYDIAYSRMLNDEIADNLIADFNASYDKKTQFIELSYNARNARGEPNYEAREIYKMLPEEFKRKLEENMGGKILVRDETFIRFFGYRDFDIRNTRFYKDSSNVTLKKIIVYSTELLKKFSKIFKIETVVKNPKVFSGNQISNFVQCYNHGMNIQDIFKYHVEGIENLKRYIELEKKLEQLKLRESLGIKINENLKKALEQDIEMNPVKKLVDKGFLNTIAEDLDSSSNAYIDRQFDNLYNKIGEVSEILQKGIDIAYLSESTEIGKALSTYTRYADFFSRYALYQGLSKQGVHEQRIFEIIMDAFIDYDAPVSKFIKAGNDYGAFMFTRFFTKSQRLLTEHLRKRPVSTTLYLATRWATGDFLGLGSDIYDTNVFEKNFDYMLNPLNPLYNIIDASTPGLLNFVPGFGEYISVQRS